MTQTQINNLKVGDLYSIGSSFRLILTISINKREIREITEITIIELNEDAEIYTYSNSFNNWSACTLLSN